ncbi:MAG TPA: MXAN_5187 family protein, partial [Anaeromyxobacteraceae bacterium]|nr:MXAN_5187 family protein [Anaeromyxobacteraceae bacterium]
TRVEVWMATGPEFADGVRGNPAVWDLLSGAAAGKVRSGRVIVDELVWTVAVAPLGNGGAIAVALPLDAAWAAAVGASTGVDVSVAAPGAKTVTTARPQEAKAIVEAGARAPRAFSDAGRLAPVPLQLPVPLPVPDAAPLFGAAPAQRVHAIPVDGLKGAQLVLSAATGADLVPLVREQWTAVFGLAALLVLGLLFGLLIRGEVSARIPAELVAAAARIEKGEFTARAPALAGKLGTVAAALNAAAEAAGRAAAEPSAPAPVEAGPNAFQLPSRPEPALEPLPPADPFAAAPALPADPAFTQPLSAPPAPERSDASGLLGGAFEAAPVRNPPAPEPVMPGPTPATPADLLLGAAKAAAPEAAADGDEAHWREVFEDFLRIRRECGEAADGLSYERFRAKLEKNRDQLVAKYACRTVRFHVYVKDGKAALKATPVRSA